jgi:hypothetical protein
MGQLHVLIKPQYNSELPRLLHIKNLLLHTRNPLLLIKSPLLLMKNLLLHIRNLLLNNRKGSYIQQTIKP